MEDKGSDSPVPRANFGVHKLNKKGKLQERILQLDYDSQMILNLNHGAVRKKWPFSQIAEFYQDKTNDLGFVILFRDFHRYELYAETSEERNIVCLLLGEILSSPGKRVPSSHYLGTPFKSGFADKKGTHIWDKRWLVLYQTRLIVFKSDIDTFPVNVVLLHNVQVGRSGENVFTLASPARPYSFKCENTAEREAWILAFHEAIETQGSWTPSVF